MHTYRDPDSDNQATNPLKDAPDDCAVVSQQAGHVTDPLAVTSPEHHRNAQNIIDC